MDRKFFKKIGYVLFGGIMALTKGGKTKRVNMWSA